MHSTTNKVVRNFEGVKGGGGGGELKAKVVKRKYELARLEFLEVWSDWSNKDIFCVRGYGYFLEHSHIIIRVDNTPSKGLCRNI